MMLVYKATAKIFNETIEGIYLIIGKQKYFLTETNIYHYNEFKDLVCKERMIFS